MTVHFSDLSIASPSEITSWEWDLDGDGTTDATQQNPEWTYTETGIYNVTLTASDGQNSATYTEPQFIVILNPGSILIWEGTENGSNYSGAFIHNYLQNNGKESVYLTSRKFPDPLTGFDAVFLSFGNFGTTGATKTSFTNSNAEKVVEYLQSGGNLYLEGGDALGYDQASNSTLLNLLGLDYAIDGYSTSKPITHLWGKINTVTEGMVFTSSSQPDNYFVDIYYEDTNSLVAFNEQTIGDVAVQNDGNFGQKTICFSYSLANLDDAAPPTTKLTLLNRIFDFFGIIIPVEFTSFNREIENSTIILSWSTATETNNRGFEIQRSSGEQEFKIIGFVDGSGTTTEQHNYTFTDYNLNQGSYSYRLKQYDFDGSFHYSDVVKVDFNIPLKFALEQNYPNPFNPTTTIKWQSPEDGVQTLKIYDVLGNEVKTLVNEFRQAGRYEISFDARSLASGIYFYRLQAGNYTSVKKMILLK